MINTSIRLSRLSRWLFAAALGTVLGLAGCHKDTPVENASDNVKDALNMRDHEKLKDAGEDMKGAAHDAKEEIKEEGREAKRDMKN